MRGSLLSPGIRLLALLIGLSALLRRLPLLASLLALLGRGTVRIVGEDGSAAPIVVAGGFCSVDHNVVTVAADRVGSEITGTAEDIDMLTETVVATDSEDLD